MAEANMESVVQESAVHRVALLSSLDRLKCDGSFCDIIIRAGNSEFGAHKVVLVACSDYFKAMFQHDFSEKNSGIITFPGKRADIVRQSIDFIYTGRVEVSQNNVKDLLDISEVMNLSELSKICVGFLASKVDMLSCAHIMVSAYRYGKKELDLPLKEFLLRNLDELTKTDDFMNIDGGSLAHCLKLLKGGGADLEEQKWSVITTWINHDPENRKSHISKLFDSLDLSFITNDFMTETILKEPLVCKSAECLLPLVTTCLARREPNMPPPAKRLEELRQIWMCKTESQIIVRYDICNKKYQTDLRFPNQLTKLAQLLSHDNRIYISTGYKIYEWANKVWRSGCPGLLAKLYPSCRGLCLCNSSCPCHPPTYCFNRCIVVGTSFFMLTQGFLNELNVVTSRLSRHYVGVNLGDGFFITASEEKIYAFGGAETENKSVEIDVKTKTQARMCPMPTPKRNGHAFWFERKAYVFGGDEYPAPLECYDPCNDQWYIVDDVHIPQPVARVHVGPSKVYLVKESPYMSIDTVQLRKLKKQQIACNAAVQGSSLYCITSSAV